ncbi:hypothetical protein CRYUN_Cryun17cG0005200 [Craigia yunnanensis]
MLLTLRSVDAPPTTTTANWGILDLPAQMELRKLKRDGFLYSAEAPKKARAVPRWRKWGRCKYPFGDYILYSNLTFTLREVKHLWRQNGCVKKYGRHLVMRTDDFEKPAKTNALCGNWRKWCQPIIWYQGNTDAVAAQFFLKNIHPDMRNAASELFGKPESPRSRPNGPDITLHMRMLMNRSVRAAQAALNCLKRATLNFQQGSRPRVVVISDTPFVKSITPNIREFAEVLHFDYKLFRGNVSHDIKASANLDFRVKDWGPAPRWVAFVDFFLASRAKHAVVSGAHRRVGTTYAQLVAALAAANSLGENLIFSILSSFQGNLLAEGVGSVGSKSGAGLRWESSAPKDEPNAGNRAQTFTYQQLENATKKFRKESLIGQGGFGAVYKGQLESTGQVVAVKQLDKAGLQGEKEFLVEVLMLSLLRHPNLVNLIGYCAEGDQRLLVYEYMHQGSLEDHLHYLTPYQKPLDWNTRMTIAAGAAKGLEYLHCEANPPVIYRDLKSSNLLLGEGFNPKLSDFGLAKFGPSGDKSHVSTRIMGTHGYCAPEYLTSGQLTMKSDIFSFGVVLLELITGRKAFDSSRAREERLLVDWVQSMLEDGMNILNLVDPLLRCQFPKSTLKKALEVAFMCIQENANSRPSISDVVLALDYLTSHPYNPNKAKRVSVKGPESNDSPKETTRMLDRDFDRERAVAEAKMWGESWREKRQGAENASDGSNS